MTPQSHSRRDFLKLSAAGLWGLALPGIFVPGDGQMDTLRLELASSLPSAALDALAAGESYDLPQPRQGRVAYERIPVHDNPSFSSPQIATYWKDTLLTITGYVLGDAQPPHNRVWYRLGATGYVHSGGIQPVETKPNKPLPVVPPGGLLGEVSVPFTDAFWGPGLNFPHTYRLYYQTTHWITETAQDKQGSTWYRLLDDKYAFEYYVPARHLRPVPVAELAPISARLPLAAKRLVVDRNSQLVIAYEWNRPVFVTRAATGARFSNGDFSTPPGYHITSYKRPYRHMAAGNLAYNGYDLPGVPWVTYFTGNGISFHGTYWHNNYGAPRSHGCVNLSPAAARWIYCWTLPSVPPEAQEADETWGTAVEVV